MARRLGAAPRGSIQQWRRLRTATVSMLLMTPTSYSFLEHLFMTIISHFNVLLTPIHPIAIEM